MAAKEKVRISLIRFFARLMYRPRVFDECGNRIRRPELEGPVILASHHVHGIDGPVVISAFSKDSDIKCLIARDWIEKPIIKYALKGGPVIPVSRTQAETAWIRDSVKELKNGASILIFPEGHARSSTEVDPFKPGFVLLATLSGASVRPMYLVSHHRQPFLRHTDIFLGQAIRVEKPREKSNKEFCEEQCTLFWTKTEELKRVCEEQKKKRIL